MNNSPIFRALKGNTQYMDYRTKRVGTLIPIYLLSIQDTYDFLHKNARPL